MLPVDVICVSAMCAFLIFGENRFVLMCVYIESTDANNKTINHYPPPSFKASL